MIEIYILMIMFIIISTIGGFYTCYKLKSKNLIYTEQKDYQTYSYYPDCISDGVNQV